MQSSTKNIANDVTGIQSRKGTFFNHGVKNDAVPGQPFFKPAPINSLQSKIIQRTPAPPPLPDNIAAYPASDRERLQISTTPVNQSALPAFNEIFATTPAAGGGSTTTIPANGTVVFSSNVPTASTVPNFDVRRGLTSIAGQMENHTNLLPLNQTITIALNLVPFGGASGNYRFSYFQHGTGTSPSEVTLIEQLTTTTTIPVAANPTTAATAGAFTAGGQSFTLGSGWTQQEQAFLMQALNMLPAAALTQITGATFTRGSASGAEAGSYTDTTHTILIRDNAFTAGLNRYEGGTEVTRMILHEIGHALDYLPLRNAWNAYQTSGAAGPLTRVKSLSGLNYTLDAASNNYTPVEGAASTDFRAAVVRDRTLRGVTLPASITTYGDTNWEENFAEAFAMYMSDRTLFQSIRPNTYTYFHGRYP